MKALPPAVLQDIKAAAGRTLEGRGLSVEDLDRWDAQCGLAPAETLDAIALDLAKGFLSQRLTYAQGDGLMNDLYQSVVETMHRPAAATPSAKQISCVAKRSLPDGPDEPLWWRIYLAFDDGEFQRVSGEDPVELYTRPALAGIVAEIEMAATAEPAATS